MPPKNKKKQDDDETSLMKAARFGRVKNTLSMGFVGLPNVGSKFMGDLRFNGLLYIVVRSS
jgi:hypothetical protein